MVPQIRRESSFEWGLLCLGRYAQPPLSALNPQRRALNPPLSALNGGC